MFGLKMYCFGDLNHIALDHMLVDVNVNGHIEGRLTEIQSAKPLPKVVRDRL